MLLPVSPWCLEALAEVVRCGSFSLAARELHITQPALSLRIKQLEEIVGHQLIRRSRRGIHLTPAGERLLEYVKVRAILDREVASDLGGKKDGELSGIVRIAGHYSAITYVVLPALAPLLRKNPNLQVEALVREDDDVPAVLERGECDFAILQRPMQKEAYEAFLLGYERYVLVQSAKFKTRHNIFIDSHQSDVITDEFFKVQPPSKRRTSYSRSFLHNETTIAKAVALGIGQAVVVEGELRANKDVRLVPRYTPLYLPNYLQCSKQVGLSRTLLTVRESLASGAHQILHKKPSKARSGDG